MEIITSVYSPDDYVYGYPASEHEQIIRCNDCKRSEYGKYAPDKGKLFCYNKRFNEDIAIEVNPDGFCSWAEPKEIE